MEQPNLKLKMRRDDPQSWLARMAPCTVLPGEILAGAGGLEEKRKIVAAFLVQLPKGGRLATVARCCNSGYELVDKITKTGFVLPELPLIPNNEIIGLKPSSAEYISYSNIYRNRSKDIDEKEKKIIEFITHVLGVSITDKLEMSLPDVFPVTRIDVGMIWEK